MMRTSKMAPIEPPLAGGRKPTRTWSWPRVRRSGAGTSTCNSSAVTVAEMPRGTGHASRPESRYPSNDRKDPVAR
jgi:hypothetical protein